MKKIVSFILCVILTFGCAVPVGAYGFSSNGTATKKATAYRLPSGSSGEVWWIDKNDKLQVFCKDGDYYLVLYPFNNTGKHVIAYVPTSAVSASGVPASSALYKNEIVRTNSNANLYHNPSTDTLTGASGSNQTVRASVSKGQELTVLFEKDGFYCVRTSNDTGFIEKGKICTHADVSGQKTVFGNAIKLNDASYHEVKLTYKESCNACGMITRETISTERENHSFSNSICTKCGYEVFVPEQPPVERPSAEGSAVCNHEKTYTVDNSVAYGTADKDIQAKDDAYHITYHYADEYCASCKSPVNKKILVAEESPHAYLNGVCTICLHQYHTEKPEGTILNINKTTFAPGEKIELTWPLANRAAGYDIHIYKEGMSARYRLEGTFKENSASIVIDDAGVFDIEIYSVNKQGYTRGDSVKITVESTETEKTAYVNTTDNLNLRLRSQPAGNAAILAKMPMHAEITTIGPASNGWYKVRYNGMTGYASAEFITFTKPSTSAAVSIANKGYVWPSSGGYLIYVLDYYYGSTRGGAHPTKGGGNIKGAIDIATAGNALATASGTIIETKYGYNSGWGNYITIKHDDGTYSFYAHLSKINVSINQRVTAGQTIGVIGTTGKSTGVHLHFEIWDSSRKTIYTIDAFKETYKKKLVYDGDIVTGGANSSAIKSWIQNNYKMSGGRWYGK